MIYRLSLPFFYFLFSIHILLLSALMPKGWTVSNICYITFDLFLLSYFSFLFNYLSLLSFRHFLSHFFFSSSFCLLFI
jgi:hypothetical protein